MIGDDRPSCGCTLVTFFSGGISRWTTCGCGDDESVADQYSKPVKLSSNIHFQCETPFLKTGLLEEGHEVVLQWTGATWRSAWQDKVKGKRKANCILPPRGRGSRGQWLQDRLQNFTRGAFF